MALLVILTQGLALAVCCVIQRIVDAYEIRMEHVTSDTTKTESGIWAVHSRYMKQPNRFLMKSSYGKEW